MFKDTSIVEVNLKISCYGGEKKSRKGEDAVVAQTNASKKAFKVTTHTFPVEITGPITKACTGLRNEFKGWGLNGRDGAIYVTRDNYPKIKELIESRWTSIQDLIDKTWTKEQYDSVIESHKSSLQALFDAAKIDSLEKIRAGYGKEIWPKKVALEQLSGCRLEGV